MNSLLTTTSDGPPDRQITQTNRSSRSRWHLPTWPTTYPQRLGHLRNHQCLPTAESVDSHHAAAQMSVPELTVILAAISPPIDVRRQNAWHAVMLCICDGFGANQRPHEPISRPGSHPVCISQRTTNECHCISGAKMETVDHHVAVFSAVLRRRHRHTPNTTRYPQKST